jgi:DNA-binding PadR family transcriptional regulator
MPKQTPPESLLPLTPLSLAILLALADEPRHGYALMKEIELQGGSRLRPGTGTLYTALERMIAEGLLEESARPRGEDARRRYYEITSFGREVARAELARLARLVELGRQKDLAPARLSFKGRVP